MNRDEHLAWCKKRALEYLDRGDLRGAFNSMLSDLQKHPQTQNHPAIGLAFNLCLIGALNTTQKMREFINGFN